MSINYLTVRYFMAWLFLRKLDNHFVINLTFHTVYNFTLKIIIDSSINCVRLHNSKVWLKILLFNIWGILWAIFEHLRSHVPSFNALASLRVGVAPGFSSHCGFQCPCLSVFRVSTDRATRKTKKNPRKRKESRREIRFPSEIVAV